LEVFETGVIIDAGVEVAKKKKNYESSLGDSECAPFLLEKSITIWERKYIFRVLSYAQIFIIF
jgi:hypothetical protein